jgi:hypothetical protein
MSGDRLRLSPLASPFPARHTHTHTHISHTHTQADQIEDKIDMVDHVVQNQGHPAGGGASAPTPQQPTSVRGSSRTAHSSLS